jgi:hypothetical protein
MTGPTVATGHSEVFDRIVDISGLQELDEIFVDEHSSEGISRIDWTHCS